MALEFRRNGRKISQRQFFDDLRKDVVEHALEAAAEHFHGRAASVVDPETGKHAVITLRRTGDKMMAIFTNGSPAFAQALEERLGVDKGEVYNMAEPAKRERLVYLAHAWEDKADARLVANGLLARGIDVWFD